MRFSRLLLGRKASALDTELLLSELTPRNGSQTLLPASIATSGDEANHQEIIPSPPPKATRKFSSGWRFNVTLSIFLGTSIFILNLVVTIWASTKFPRDKDVVTVHEGSCSKVKTTITCIHLAVNILGTLLLGASNVCMQLLCAPTRGEIDAAHARHKWLGIGISSLKNLFYVDRKKSALWVLLGLNSIPLHLLWNSAFVNDFSDNSYVFSVVTEGFLQGASYNATPPRVTRYPDVAQSMLNRFRNQSLVLLHVPDCINVYGNEYVSDYSNLLLVFNMDDDYNNSLLFQDQGSDSAGRWICGYRDCDLSKLIRQNAMSWNPFSYDAFASHRTPEWNGHNLDGSIKYCLAEKANIQCRLGMSLPIMLTVLGCNVVKTVCFIMTLLIGGFMYPLVTNGDAIQSFLLRPDIGLQGRCLISRSEVDNKHFWSGQPLPRSWQSGRRPWAAGATISFWLATFIPYAANILSLASCLILTVRGSGILLITTIIAICIKNSVWVGGSAALVSSGFGKATANQLVGSGAHHSSTPVESLLANTPQILVSYIYLAYNGLFTSMLATAEWVDYSVRRRGLRVAWPRGQQRATNFLSLPYSYAVPIMAASTTLHWLISESLFLVRITKYDVDGSESMDSSISAVGYSPYAAVFALSMGGAMLIAVLLVGVLKRYPATMPLAACCSASIAALCQPPGNMAKDEMTLKRLQWGVIDQTLSTDDHGEVEHACFSAGDVTPLVSDRMYA